MGEQVNKTNFLGIYGWTHLCVLTHDNVKAAFQKTGVWPFNPGVISKEMITPSKETSCEGHLPIAPSTPVWVLAKMLQLTQSQRSQMIERRQRSLKMEMLWEWRAVRMRMTWRKKRVKMVRAVEMGIKVQMMPQPSEMPWRSYKKGHLPVL